MNILVTGGSGFIGTRLVTELLAAGHEVTVFDVAASSAHPAIHLRGDVRDIEALTTAGAGRDAIIHLAAEHRDDPQSAALAEAVNLGGTRNLVAAARQAGCRRILFTSSVAVYPLNVPEATEEDPPEPYNRYGQTKLQAEQVLGEWARSTPGSSLTLVRPCVVFGEGNRGNVYKLLRQIQRRRFVMVGGGHNRKSMAYVGNLTRFLAVCLSFPAGVHLYNYADKPDLTAGELVRLARRELLPGAAVPCFRLPHWAGLFGGLVCDALSRVSGHQSGISAIRIRKFCAETTVSTRRLDRLGFVRPCELEKALLQTMRHEFKPGGNQ
ncbi:MAG TPA: NAD(P)-dependent oxidoreductase [Candidatus Paceibacterota bacterium]|nr:NAD(P)-dependent oxidoreductase [Verrucomicrobiota bacterium]HSA12683.1 NAD(P)-dependent oxidoreductase [Candidatus Paceibacterota bacterium]